TDFGLAKLLDADSSQTQSGVVMGTPRYMAPEQATGSAKGIGPSADVYALGAILYECLTGRPPFLGATALDTLQQGRSAEPGPPSSLQPKVPRDVETVCLKCLQKEPARRYAAAAALADDLSRFREGRPVQVRPTGLFGRLWMYAKRRPQITALSLMS